MAGVAQPVADIAVVDGRDLARMVWGLWAGVIFSFFAYRTCSGPEELVERWLASCNVGF